MKAILLILISLSSISAFADSCALRDATVGQQCRNLMTLQTVCSAENATYNAFCGPQPTQSCVDAAGPAIDVAVVKLKNCTDKFWFDCSAELNKAWPACTPVPSAK